MARLAAAVSRLEREREEAVALAGEILATLELNRPLLFSADDPVARAHGEVFDEIRRRWRRRLEAVG